MSIRIVIADDHNVVRQGLRMVLALDPDMDVVGEAADGAEVLTLVRQLHPDVVVMDLAMPDVDGITATAVIRAELPDTEVVALTSALDDTSVRRAIQAGVIGYLLKDTGADEIRHAVRQAAAKRSELSPLAVAQLVHEVRTPDSLGSLTEREKEVLSLLGQGQTNKAIGDRLHISNKTVAGHVTSILAKLGMQSRTEAAVHAVRIGLVPPASE
jgi:DNA-binding NarL/FixJ family response regulator